MPNRLFVRAFLNSPDHHGGAYIRAIVPDSSRAKGESDYYSPVLELADCSRQVSFSFDMHDGSARRNSLRKARRLAETLRRFAEALEAEAEVAALDQRRRARSEAAERRRSRHPFTVSIHTPANGSQDRRDEI